MISAAPGAAHQVSVSTGTVVVESGRVTVTLKVPAEDLLHQAEDAKLTGQCTAEWLNAARVRHESTMLKALVIHDTDGARLSGRVVSSSVLDALEPTFDSYLLRRIRLSYALEYAMPEAQQFLTFRLDLGHAPPRIHAQLALDVRRPGDREGRTVLLTSRGNAETLEFPSEGPERSSPIAAPDRFKAVLADIRADDAGLTIEVLVPLTLLETWRPITRRDADFLSPAEQSAAAAALVAFFRGRNLVRFDGAPPSGALTQVAFLTPAGGKGDGQSLGAWTARVAVATHYSAARQWESAELTWGLFNNVVLNARAAVKTQHRTFDHQFTTYEPTMNVRKGR